VWGAFQERFGIPRIVEMYGATEGNVALQNLDGRVGSVGKPHALLEDQVALVRFDHAAGDIVRDADGRGVSCEDGEAGELLGKVGTTGAMEYDGYTDRAATERKLLRDVFEAGDAWFRTGDLLRCDAEGYYYFVDRIGDTFRWKGENVATQEVADVLNGAGGVGESTVYGVQLPGEDGRAGMAALVLTRDAVFDGAAFYAHAERHLPRYAMPAIVRLVDAVEVTGTLKQRKQRVVEEGYDPALVTDPLFVRDDAARRYVPLTLALHDDLRQGRLRL
jgi:fatty-acyl-CoA synthase